MCLVACASEAPPRDPEPCNGSVELCDRPFDEVVFAATHNSHAAQADGYTAVNANQISGLQQQLADGVRALLIDVYEDAGESVFCHGPCQLARTSHVAGLSTLKAFLEAHPRDVVTILYEDHLAPERIAEDFAAVGLDQLVHQHAAGGAWPTLGEMIDAGTRLVVTAENAGPPPAWLHHLWDEAWDTPYDFRDPSEFSCELNRGARENRLFLINHWIGSDFGLPSEADAIVVNAYATLHARAQRCADESDDVPNFIAVDFYEHGDLFDVVADLNAARD